MSEPPDRQSGERGNEPSTHHPHEPASPQRRRILWKLFLSFCVFSLISLGLLAWYVTTDSFQALVRRRVVATIEKMTGGRVELGELHTIPFRLRVDARNLTIHGREAPDQEPFFRVERVQAELKIISLLSTTVGLHSLELDHPVVHIIDYPDGTTNAPEPEAARISNQGPVEQLISLSVSLIEVRRGELLWEDKKVPFEVSGLDLGLLMNYSFLRRRYEARVTAGGVTTAIQRYPSFVWKADASLILGRGHVDIGVLNLSSGKSEVHFKGSLQDFHNPQISGDYRGIVDLGELAALTHQPQLRRGTAQFQGNGSWNLQTYSAQGSVQSKDIDWSNGKVSTRNSRINANLAITPDRFRASSIKANVLGGDVQGEVDVTNWQNSLTSTPVAGRRQAARKVVPAGLQRGSVRVLLSGFPLLPVIELLSTRKTPLDRIALSGNMSGNVEMLWVGSIRDAETHLKIGIEPAKSPAPGEIPVDGHVDGIYRGSRDELEITQLHLNTSGSEITANGNLAATSLLHFSLTSHNLREWMPLLEELNGSQKLPFAIHGWATLNGTASGTVSAPAVNGNFEVYDFDTNLPATERTSGQVVHWDALTSTVQYSSGHFSAHNGSLIHGHATAHFDASAVLTGGRFEDDDAFALHVDLRNADAAELAHFAGVEQPLAGMVDLSASISGTPNSPHGDGHIEVRNGMIYGESVPRLRTDLRLADNELQFNNVDASAYDAPLSGNAAFNIQNRQFRATFSGRNLSFARFPFLQNGRITADGIADFTAHASGTTEQPSIDAHVHIKDLAVDNEKAGDFYLDAVTHGRQLDLKARSDFQNADISIQGKVQLEHDFPADLSLSFHHLDVDWLLRTYLPGKITGHSPLDGTLQVRGPLRTPVDLKASAELQSFSAEIDHVQVQSAEPIRFEVADESVTIKNFHLSGSGTDFTAHGRAHLTGSRELDLQAEGSVNMTLLQSFNPKILARGSLNVSLNASGTMDKPVLQGRLEVKDTFLSHNDFPSGLSDLNGVLLFDRNRLEIDNLVGTAGGGKVALTGSATYQSGGTILIDLGATARDVRLRYPPGVSSTANADLRLTGTSNAALLSGDVVVTKLAVTPGFDFGAYIERSKQGGVFAQGDTIESHLKLDVHVVTTPELQMQTAIARLSGNADLRVRGTADRPAILGRVEVSEGEISFNGTKYKLERGDVTFANPAKTQPIIDMTATTRVRDYDITVQFRGDASVTNGLKVTWQSEPQLPEADVIALLALGRTREESAAVANNGGFGFGGDASNLLINEALNSTVNSRLQHLFGASRVKIDPQGLASETNVVRGPQVTVEQQVANNLTLTYSTNVSVSNQQIIQVEYNVTRNISIVALRDQNGVVSFDFKIRRRKK